MGQITSAKFTGKEKAEATLILFDGGYGTVEVSKWTARYEGAWALQWLALPGGAIEWTDSGWRRAAPVQLTLFDGGTAP